MTPAEIKADYEANTGEVIVETFQKRDPLTCPAVLVASHGPFAWGETVGKAVHNAIVFEHVVRMASETMRVAPRTKPMQQVLLDKHFLRKHGPGAYYGQGKSPKNPLK
jgi:L-ribulose-5-phosphate 4-epimerase